MSSRPDDDLDTRDGEILADLFDELLQTILEGRTPDLAQCLPDRPDLADRVARTWSLACSVAGRREPSRPVLGGYEIVRELGHGGMGTVYLARHQILQRDVAIKVLPQSLAMSPLAKRRFLEEAKALARIRHDHVVNIHRVLDHTQMLAFEMEHIDGANLQDIVQGLRASATPLRVQTLAELLGLPVAALGTRSPVEWFVRTCSKVARALGEVHRHGLIHRDVKPANILLRKDGSPVLADFGLARDDDAEGPRTGAFAGTAIYAAPERLRDGDRTVDVRCDIYSLGVTLYELLTLDAPFRGSSTHEVLRRIENGRLPSLRERAPHVSRDLALVVQKAMEPEARDRYPTADAFADDLDRLLALEPIQAQPQGVLRRAAKFVRRNQRLVLAAAAGAAVAVSAAWPVVAHARAREEARVLAAERLQAARSLLLSPEALHLAWTESLAGTSLQPLRDPATRTAYLSALEATAAAYDDVVGLDPDNAAARSEREVLLAALAVQRDRSTTPTTQRAPEVSPALAPAVTALREHGSLAQLPAATSPSERFARGLLAFLVGDATTADAAWDGLEDRLDHPLFEACRALQQTTQGHPERAYPRLFRAIRTFPAAKALALAMADAALEMGDTALAREWIDRAPGEHENPITLWRRRLLEADLLAATGEDEKAASIYRELCERDFSDSVPPLRLAAQAGARGDRAAARRLLVHVLRRWPDQAVAHRQLAWLALQQRDLPGYLREVRFALSRDPAHTPIAARHACHEILRIGGLQALSEPAAAQLGAHRFALPLSSWLRPSLCAAIGQTLRVVAAIDRADARARVRDARPVGAALLATWLCAGELPGLFSLAPWRLRLLTLGGIPAVLGTPTDLATALLSPFQRILGNRAVIVQPEDLVAKHDEPQRMRYATAMLRLGDVDGDSLEDFGLCSSPSEPESGSARIEVRSLADGGLLRTLRCREDRLQFGLALSAVPDVDGDRCSELLIGCPAYPETGTGRVELRSGRTDEVLWERAGDQPAFGRALAAVADVDGDGWTEFVAGIPGVAEARPSVLLCSGRDGATLRTLEVEPGTASFGSLVVRVGDLDADGLADLVVTDAGDSGSGKAVAYSGRTWTTLFSFAGSSATANFGFRAVDVGDVDGDGHDDLAISAPGYGDYREHAGEVSILSGKTGRLRYLLRGDRKGDLLGTSLCALPHWRADGRPALAVAAMRGGPGGTGYVRVFDLATGQPLQTLAANPSVRLIGASLLDLGDRDHDGLRDLGIPITLRGGASMVWSTSFALIAGR